MPARVRSMPIRSSRSSVARMPAVSMKRKRTPSMTVCSSIRSRVVPAISETIALSSFSSRLSSVLLPTFGAPTIATGMPSFRALPSAKEPLRRRISDRISSIVQRSFRRSANSTSSSEKSSSSSSSEARCTSSPRRWSSRFEKPPRSCPAASVWAALDEEAIRSATASACDRSSLPARKARSVNSPGVAMRAPASSSSRRISETT